MIYYVPKLCALSHEVKTIRVITHRPFSGNNSNIDNENDIGNDIDYDIDNNSENYNNFDKNNDREFVVRKFRAQMLHHPLLTIWQPKLEA